VLDHAARLWRVVVAVVQHSSLPVLVVALVLAAEPVDRLAVRSRGQPRAGIRRHTVDRPAPHRRRRRLRRCFSRDAGVAVAPGQGGDDPRPLFVVGAGNRPRNVRHRNGRTSTLRLHAFDPAAASFSATSRSDASTIQKPATCSFDSTKGPSVNTACPFLLSIVVAVSGDPRPPAKTQWPSARSPSLNRSIAAISPSVASSELLLITEKRHCIASHLL